MKKFRNLKMLSKVAIVLSILLIATVVTATFILHFGEIDTELNIETAITIDNQSYHIPFKHKLHLYSGDSIKITHTIYNRAKTCNVMINQTTSGLIEGVTLLIYDSNDSLITFPFRLNATSTMKITMIYHADVNLESQKVKITTKFSVSEI